MLIKFIEAQFRADPSGMAFEVGETWVEGKVVVMVQEWWKINGKAACRVLLRGDLVQRELLVFGSADEVVGKLNGSGGGLEMEVGADRDVG